MTTVNSHAWPDVPQGDSFARTIVIRAPGGLDLTGCVVTLLLKSSHNQNAEIFLTLDSATVGGITLDPTAVAIRITGLTKAVTKALAAMTYAKELSIAFPDGVTNKTILRGTWTIREGGKP